MFPFPDVRRPWSEPQTTCAGPRVQSFELRPCEHCGRTQGQHGLLGWLRCGLDTPPSTTGVADYLERSAR